MKEDGASTLIRTSAGVYEFLGFPSGYLQEIHRQFVDFVKENQDNPK